MSDPAKFEPPTQKEPWISVYGFVSWIISYVVFGVYLLWALAYDEVLISFGISHYPSKAWAMAVPLYFTVCIAAYPIVVHLGSLKDVPDITSPDCLRDAYTRHPVAEKFALPAAADIPLAVANQLVYRPEEVSRIFQLAAAAPTPS